MKRVQINEQSLEKRGDRKTKSKEFKWVSRKLGEENCLTETLMGEMGKKKKRDKMIKKKKEG